MYLLQFELKQKSLIPKFYLRESLIGSEPDMFTQLSFEAFELKTFFIYRHNCITYDLGNIREYIEASILRRQINRAGIG